MRFIRKLYAFPFFRNKLRKELFSETGGLFGSQADEWWRARSLVQQDMLRPESAMFYMDDMEEISQELVDKMSACLLYTSDAADE